MNKKLLGIVLSISALCAGFIVQAQTTGDFEITINPDTLEITVSLSGATTGTIQTGTIINPPVTGTEFEQALRWMYANGLTMYDNENDYRPEDGLLREEAAKIIGQAFIVLGYDQATKNSSCSF